MLFIIPLLSYAQTYYHLDNWTTENGLPQNVILGLCQTPDSYLWLATMDGLVRFDGVRFVTFNRGNTPGDPWQSIHFVAMPCQWRSLGGDRNQRNYAVQRGKI